MRRVKCTKVVCRYYSSIFMAQKTHLCTQCKKTFSRPSKLQSHIAYHHEKKVTLDFRVYLMRKSQQLSIGCFFSSFHSNALYVVNRIRIKTMSIDIFEQFIRKKICQRKSIELDFIEKYVRQLISM